MALAYYIQTAGKMEITGLSSDTKPVNPEAGWTFVETNTDKFFNVVDGVWTEVLNSAYGTQANLDLKAPLASPAFTGTVAGVTASMVGAPSGSGTSSGTNTGDQTLPTDATISTSDITTNNVSTAKHGWMSKLPGGTTNFFREDGSWQPAGGGTATWGSVVGTLSNQTDLQSVLDMKQNSVLGITSTEISYLDGVTSSVVSINNTQTLSNKTLVTPSIASFAQAQHTHQDGAGGGLFNASSVFSMTGGQIKTSILGTGTANNTTFLRGDSAWATPAGGSGRNDISIVYPDGTLGTAVAWSNMPSVLTEFVAGTTRRLFIDLTGFTKWKVSMEQTVAAASGANLGIQYSPDLGTTWKGIDNDTTNAQSTTRLALRTSAGFAISGEGTITASAQTSVLTRVTGLSGNGVADPAFRNGIITYYS